MVAVLLDVGFTTVGLSVSRFDRVVGELVRGDGHERRSEPPSVSGRHPGRRGVVLQTGPLEVFSTAVRFLRAESYRTEVVSTHGGPVRARCGLESATSSIAGVDARPDTLVIAGGADMGAPSADAELLHHVRRLAVGAQRVASVCSGAFLMAAAGLLDGRRATTHWAECRLLAQRYPSSLR